MKWIGQNIWSFISRFRSDVYLEASVNPAADVDKFLVQGADGKVGFRTGAEVLSDIGGSSTTGDVTSIVAGTGLSGTSLTGPIPTLNVDAAQTGITSLGTLSSLSVGTTGKLNFRDGNSFINSPTANDLEIAATDITLDSAGSVIVETDNMSVNSANANDPVIQIKNTANDNTSGRLQFNTNRGADGEDDDVIGRIIFFGQDDGTPDAEQYAEIQSTIHDATNNEESGKISLKVAAHDGDLEDGLVITGGDVNTEVDVVIGNGHAQTTTITGNLVMGSVLALRNGGELNVAAQPNITTLAGVSAIGSAATPITITSDAVTFTSASADDPLIKIQNTTDNDQGARLFLWKARTDSSIQPGEADDEIGALYFYGYDSASNLQGYGRIETFIDVATNGQESGIMQIGVASHDGGFNNGLYMKGGDVDTEVDVTVASGASSVTTIAGTLTMGSTAAMTNAGLLSVANQSNVTGLGTISSGVWQGTTIKTAYIGDDQVTEDKLANTLLAEIDANTAKNSAPNIFGEYIKLLISDFATNKDGGNTKHGIGFDPTATDSAYGIKVPNALTELFAFVSIPEGMKATHVEIFDNGENLAVEVFEVQINASTVVSKGTGNCNTEFAINNSGESAGIAATATNQLAIKITTTSVNDDRIRGGRVKIAAQ